LLYKRRDALLNWVRGGGCLILHGERHIALLLRHCELPWQMGAYTRETHLLASKDNGVLLANPSLARLTPTISIKPRCSLTSTLHTDCTSAHPKGDKTRIHRAAQRSFPSVAVIWPISVM
jgi:hypothetical protein